MSNTTHGIVDMSNTTHGIADAVKNLDGFKGEACLYRCSPPMKSPDILFDEDGEFLDPPKPGPTYELVIVSCGGLCESEPETYIFGADANGRVVNWGELHGSFMGGHNIEEALENAGYRVVPGPIQGDNG